MGGSSITTAKSSDLKRVIIRCLVLLVRGREEVRTSLRAPQIEINRDALLSPAGGGGSRTLRDHSVSVLVASDPHEVLAGEAEARQDDRQVHARGWQFDRLQLAWLFAAVRGRTPKIDLFRDRRRLREHPLSAFISRPCNQAGDKDNARGTRQCPSHLPPLRSVLLPERQQLLHAVGTCCRVVDARIGQRNALGLARKIPQEPLTWTRSGGSRFAGEYSSLMLLGNPGLKAVLRAGRPAPA